MGFGQGLRSHRPKHVLCVHQRQQPAGCCCQGPAASTIHTQTQTHTHACTHTPRWPTHQLGLPHKRQHRVVWVAGVAHRVGAAQQHLERDVGDLRGCAGRGRGGGRRWREFVVGHGGQRDGGRGGARVWVASLGRRGAVEAGGSRGRSRLQPPPTPPQPPHTTPPQATHHHSHTRAAHLLPQLLQAPPGALVQEPERHVKGSPAPHLQAARPRQDVRGGGGRTQHVYRPHACGQQALVGITHGCVGEQHACEVQVRCETLCVGGPGEEGWRMWSGGGGWGGSNKGDAMPGPKPG